VTGITNIVNEWAIEVTDDAAFLQYRGVDVVAVWLGDEPSISLAHHAQFIEWAVEADRNEWGETPIDDASTDWGRADERIIALDGIIQIIDSAIAAVEACNIRSKARRHLIELADGIEGRTDDDVRRIIEEYLGCAKHE
jgi:hypothetical protein